MNPLAQPVKKNNNNNKFKLKSMIPWGIRKLDAAADAIKNPYCNMGRSVPVETKTTFKCPTWTCALMQISANDSTTLEELQYQIERAKIESRLTYSVETRSSGERAAFLIVCPFENKLREKVIQCGFVKVFEFERRTGYKPGILEMYCIKW